MFSQASARPGPQALDSLKVAVELSYVLGPVFPDRERGGQSRSIREHTEPGKQPDHLTISSRSGMEVASDVWSLATGCCHCPASSETSE